LAHHVVVGEASSEEEAMIQIAELHPDDVFIDLVSSAAQAMLQRIRRAHPGIRVHGVMYD
jgi:DNA-binding NarL/FixJ family response regulator